MFSNYIKKQPESATWAALINQAPRDAVALPAGEVLGATE